eukprot:jgi/Chlat1/8981/Chrsp94S08274
MASDGGEGGNGEGGVSEGGQRRVLVSVDHSNEAMHALEWALEQLARKEDKIVMVHAQPPVPVYTGHHGMQGWSLPAGVEDNLENEIMAAAKTLGADMLALCRDRGFAAEYHVFKGPTLGDVICDAVSHLKGDMLVIGARRISALKRAFVGSTSDFCAHHLDCPVIVVKKPVSEPMSPRSPPSQNTNRIFTIPEE